MEPGRLDSPNLFSLIALRVTTFPDRPQQAEEILAQGKADIIDLCRALRCDPDWPLKAKEGRARDIVSCTACNWCLEADSRIEKVNCSRWPEGSLEAPTPWTKKDARASALSKTAEGE